MVNDNGPDGIGGTDGTKVLPLFPNQPSALPLPVQPEVIGVLQQILNLAQQGHITGFAMVTFDENSQGKFGIVGKCPHVTLVGILSNLKFDLQFRNAVTQGPK